MIFIAHKYSPTSLLKIGFIAILLSLLYTEAAAQISPFVKDSSSTKTDLSFYHTIAPVKTPHPFQHIDYTRPNDQLMSWPNFPLTPTEIERRHRVMEQENKPSSIIAKDIIKNILGKKKKVAVIPKF